MPRVLVASDADWIHEDVDAALSGRDTTVQGVRSGREVFPALAADAFDLVVLDLQIGNMGGMATCLGLRLEAGAGRLPEVRVLMLLDRPADIFLAQRSQSDGWLVKPLDAFRLRRAAKAIIAGGRYEDPIEHWGAADAS